MTTLPATFAEVPAPKAPMLLLGQQLQLLVADLSQNQDTHGTWMPPTTVPPHLHHSIRKAIPEYEAALVPISKQDMTALLHRVAQHFWTDRSEAGWTVIFEDYHRLLGDVPADLLQAGIDAFLLRPRRLSFPQAGEIREGYASALAERQVTLRRLRAMNGQPTPSQAESRAGWDGRPLSAVTEDILERARVVARVRPGPLAPTTMRPAGNTEPF